jgi:hypothetical protein
MMKRNTYFVGVVVALALLLSGCDERETTRTTSNIAFKPLIGHDTRAVESVPFPQDRNFKVWGVNQTSGQALISGETINHTANGWVSTQKWPLDMMQFEAYWPTDLPMEFNPAEGLQLRNFDCGKGDVDILVATAIDDNEDDDVVVLSFDHILSRVEFRMMHSLSEGMSVRLKKVRMVGYANKGDYNTVIPRDWLVDELDHTTVIYDAGDTDGIEILPGEAQYIGEEFYVIPQACIAALEVTYDVRYGEAGWIPETETIESLKTFWEPSKHYTYTVNLRMDKLTHTTGISSWNNRE